MPRFTLPIAALLVLAPTLTVVAQAASGEVDAGKRLQQSIDYISSLPAYSVAISLKFEMNLTSGESDESLLSAVLAVSGKDKARLRVDVPDGAMELFYTPDAKHIYIAAQNQYVDGSAFATRQNALAAMPGREFRPAQILLSDLLHNDFSLVEEAEDIQFVQAQGTEPATTDQVRLTGGGIVVDFWIQKGDKPLLEKFALNMTEMVAQASPTVESATADYTFSEWNLSPAFEEGHFAFQKPDGATELQRAQRPEDPLKGEPAPQITLGLLGSDKSMDLASHKGKEVVILDFWASWCGPCRIGLPIVTEVVKQFEEKGVVLYAVNVGEDPRRAQAFAEETGLAATVALDTERKAARLYGASSIPLTVIIDKDGTVHEVHRGVSPALKQELTATLTELTE